MMFGSLKLDTVHRLPRNVKVSIVDYEIGLKTRKKKKNLSKLATKGVLMIDAPPKQFFVPSDYTGKDHLFLPVKQSTEAFPFHVEQSQKNS